MRLLSVVFVAAAVLAAAPAASASPPNQAAGTLDFQVVALIETNQADGNTFFEQTNVGTLTGTFTGAFETRIDIVRHEDGTFRLQGTRTCVCTVDARTGTVAFSIVGGGVFGVSFFGRLVVLSADGALEGVHSVQSFAGTFVGPGHGVGSYEGTYHSDP